MARHRADPLSLNATTNRHSTFTSKGDTLAKAGGEKLMSDAIAFEFQGKTVGVLARHGEGFIFYSGVAIYHALDGRVFAEPRDLYLELRRLDDERRRAGAGPFDARRPLADPRTSAAA